MKTIPICVYSKYKNFTHSYIRLPISKINTHTNRGRRCRDHMVVGFMQSVPITTNVVRQDKIRKLYFDSAHNKTVQHKL
jgi:hypothetical protein